MHIASSYIATELAQLQCFMHVTVAIATVITIWEYWHVLIVICLIYKRLMMMVYVAQKLCMIASPPSK